MNERALSIIVSALSCYPERPYDESFPKHEQEEITFSQWALNEILNLVWDHPFTPAADTIEEFALKCQLYKAQAQLPKQKRVFTIAEQTALEILEKIKEAELSCQNY